MLISPKAASPMFVPDEELASHKVPRIDYDRYVEQWFATPDGWRQLSYVHSDLMSKLDSIDERTMIAAIMEPWREAHRLGTPTEKP
jgi:hypothetical protein